MANYGYINIRVGPPGAEKKDRIAAFGPILLNAVTRTLDDRWKVELSEHDDDGPVWWVYLPGTAVKDDGKHACTIDGRAFEEDIGFPVALQARSIAFRHGHSHFAGWAQGRVEEELSQYYGHGIFYDATDRTTKPGPRQYRKGKTFWDYITRNLKKPLSEEDRQYVEFYKRGVPEGHWGEPGNV